MSHYPTLHWQLDPRRVPGVASSRIQPLRASLTPAILGHCTGTRGDAQKQHSKVRGREAGQSHCSVCMITPGSPLSHTPHNTPKSIASYYYNINIQYSYNNTIDFLLRGCT